MKCTPFACVQSLISSCFFRDTPVKTITYGSQVNYQNPMIDITDMETLEMIDRYLFAVFAPEILHRYVGV